MPKHGTELKHSKLTPEIVRAIRIRASMGVPHHHMASQYRVHVNTIGRVVTYQNWWRVN